MKKILVGFSVITVLLSGGGCIKNTVCKAKTVQSEQATIVNYAGTSGMTATAHSSGLYYQITNPATGTAVISGGVVTGVVITNPGSGPTPTSGSNVFIKYTGKLLNGTVFDSQTTTPVSYGLSGMIQGFQIGLPLIQKGGSIKLIVPSSLGYGCAGFGSVPPNSILYFEVELTDVQ